MEPATTAARHPRKVKATEAHWQNLEQARERRAQRGWGFELHRLKPGDLVQPSRGAGAVLAFAGTQSPLAKGPGNLG